jgi:hypothetical protein
MVRPPADTRLIPRSRTTLLVAGGAHINGVAWTPDPGEH